MNGAQYRIFFPETTFPQSVADSRKTKETLNVRTFQPSQSRFLHMIGFVVSQTIPAIVLTGIWAWACFGLFPHMRRSTRLVSA